MTDHIQKIHYFRFCDNQIACCAIRAPKILEGKFYTTNTQFVTCERCIDSLRPKNNRISKRAGSK